MGIGEADASEIWHGVCFNPDTLVEYPVAQVHQDSANPIDIVITANHPNSTGILQYTTAGLKPVLGEFVVLRKICKAVPFVIHGVNLGEVGPP